MKTIICSLLFLLLSLSIVAQDLIHVNADLHGNLYFDITIVKGHTIYGLASAVGASPSDLLSLNSKTDGSLSLEEQIILPLRKEVILDEHGLDFTHLPVYYTTKQGDNLYRLAKAAGTSTNQLMAINDKSNSSLSLNEVLRLGWIEWPYVEDPSLTVTRGTDDLAVVQRSHQISPLILERPSVPKIPALSIAMDRIIESKVVKEKGIAYWEKADYGSAELMVMHPHARVNSKISLYNPMLKRKVQAEVVSELPKEMYPEDISVVISPSVASALGALDSRFQVEITYVE